MCFAESLKLTTAQQYVQKLSTQAVYAGLTSGGGSAVIAGLDGSSGRALAVQCSDRAVKTKLEAALKRLRTKLGIAGPAQDWQQDDVQFQVGVVLSTH